MFELRSFQKMYERFFTNSKTEILIKAGIACLLMLTAYGDSFAQQYKGLAVKKEKLISVLRSKQLQTREIVEIVKSNGVDFLLSAPVQTELVKAGARPEVIEAVRSNYRAAAAPVTKPPANTTGNKTKFTGTPLTKDAIIALLENRVADLQVRKNVESRGVSFQTNSQVLAEIKKAGGSVALLNLIASSYVKPNIEVPVAVKPSAPTTAEIYDGLIDKAVDQYDNKSDKQGALATLQEAVKLNAGSARAYQILGYMNLYGFTNYVEAERNMKESLARGGSAVFRVFHDHSGTFSTFCKGSLYVAKDTVRFESDDNLHTFQTTDADIQKIKTNSAFKRAFQTKNGSYQIVLKSGDKDGIKYNFAPLTDKIDESKLVIRLVGKE
jgi:TPR repeat protein